MLSIRLADEAATIAFGKRLGQVLTAGGTVFLNGTLGAGKTTLCRGVLSAFGHSGAVKSPTYTLVEPYQFGDVEVFHFDLYRLGDAEELEFMGIREYFGDAKLCLIEWPERGYGFIPEQDISVSLSPVDKQRQLEIEAFTSYGEDILAELK